MIPKQLPSDYVCNEYAWNAYIDDVHCQLSCNNPNPVDFIVYDYTNEQVKQNETYFRNCLRNGLSGYKALLFFGDYLAGEYRISSYQMVTKK